MENIEIHSIPATSRQSPPDYRTISASAAIGDPGVLPDSFFVDVSKLPIWNQKKIGSCTSHAGTKYRQNNQILEDGQLIDYSPRFAYAMAKCMDGSKDEGTYPRLIAKVLQKYGAPTQATMPNDCDITHAEYVFNFDMKNIPQAAFDEAAEHKIDGYAEVTDLSPNGLKNAIFKASGAMLLTRIGSEWWTSPSGKVSWAASDIMPLRAPQNVVGGHETFLYGYETVGSRLKLHIVNSFSDKWGDHGKGWFWYDEYKPFINEVIIFTKVPEGLLEKIKGLPAPRDFKHFFSVDLVSQNSNVVETQALQIALMLDGSMSLGDFTDVRFLGFFGEQTEAAVRAFQSKYALPVTGKADLPTRRKLNSLYNL